MPNRQQRVDGDLIALVTVPQNMAKTPRERLACQLHTWRAVESFVPLATRNNMPLSVWPRVCKENNVLIRKELDRLRAFGQISIVATPTASPNSAQGGSWLRQRAKAKRARETLCAFLSDFTTPDSARLAQAGDRIVLHLLVPKQYIASTAQDWSNRLQAYHPAIEHWRFAISAGWPPSAFCEDMPA